MTHFQKLVMEGFNLQFSYICFDLFALVFSQVPLVEIVILFFDVNHNENINKSIRLNMKWF